MDRRTDLTLVSLVFFIFLFLQLFGGGTAGATASLVEPTATVALPVETEPLSAPAKPDQLAFAAPYDTYWITQRLHGQSYGHNAIDLGGGKGSSIKSPINGVVADLYIDKYENTVLVLENEVWIVTLFHGDYTVAVGETVVIGQTVGTESNHGNTTDMQGRSCKGRDCGYHTHLNVFDKRSGTNANPLELLGED
jgi:hypothetical protein